MASSIGRASVIPRNMSMKPDSSDIMATVDTERRTASWFFWPRYVAITAFAPMAMPKNRFTSMLIMGPLLPTAAMAWVVE